MWGAARWTSFKNNLRDTSGAALEFDYLDALWPGKERPVVHMEKPVKPKKPTSADVGAAMMKRKNILITVRKNVPNGTFDEVNKAAEEFAAANNKNLSDVKIGWHWGQKVFSVKRRETDSEKEKRIRYDLNSRYHSDIWAYERAMDMIRARYGPHCDTCSCNNKP